MVSLQNNDITDFQKRVFNEVKKIPSGKTKSYKEIAEKLNTSPRAIGQALKKNPWPVEVPCHRVIKSDRTLGGYKGKDEIRNPDSNELKRKKQLLERETKTKKKL